MRKNEENEDVLNGFKDKHICLNQVAGSVLFYISFNWVFIFSLLFQKEIQANFIQNEQKYNMQALNLYTYAELDDLKRKRIVEIRLKEIFKEIFLYCIFLFILYYISYTNISISAYTYNKLFQHTFVDKQSSNELGLNEVCFQIKNLFFPWKVVHKRVHK